MLFKYSAIPAQVENIPSERCRLNTSRPKVSVKCSAMRAAVETVSSRSAKMNTPWTKVSFKCSVTRGYQPPDPARLGEKSCESSGSARRTSWISEILRKYWRISDLSSFERILLC